MTVDLHQHLWTAPLLEALGERDCPPFVRETECGAVLMTAGEQPYVIDRAAQRPELRAAEMGADGVSRAVIALSSPIGIEALPRAASEPLIEAHLAGVDALGDAFAAWGPLPLDGAGPEDVDVLLDRGCVGISVPAGALADHDRLRELEPALARLAEHRAPLFVHPGPGHGDRPAAPSLTDPLWWPALTRYVAEMQAAWLTFASAGRRAHPSLVVVFAMLAGGAPLLAERLRLRGGPPVDPADPRTHYDTSGSGPALVDAVAAVVGQDRLVYGSDRPVVDPPTLARRAAYQANAAALLARLPAGASA